MAGTNEDDDMSSKAHNAGSKLLQGGKVDQTDWGLLVERRSRREGREKLSVDFDRARLQGVVGISGQGVGIVTLCKVAFSSCKAALASKN